MEASEVSLEHVRNGYCRLSATIRSKLPAAGLPTVLFLRLQILRLCDTIWRPSGGCATTYFVPIMVEDLIVHAPVTRDLMQQIPRILGKFKEFYPEFTYIQTVADSYEDAPLCPDEHRRSASFSFPGRGFAVHAVSQQGCDRPGDR